MNLVPVTDPSSAGVAALLEQSDADVFFLADPRVDVRPGPRMFERMGRVLRENGYTVFAAGSVKETLDIFRKEKGNFHLVFTDVVLPDKTGVQLAEVDQARRDRDSELQGALTRLQAHVTPPTDKS